MRADQVSSNIGAVRSASRCVTWHEAWHDVGSSKAVGRAVTPFPQRFRDPMESKERCFMGQEQVSFFRRQLEVQRGLKQYGESCRHA